MSAVLTDVLTPAQISYYLGTYRFHRESTPLPPGWRDFVSDSPGLGQLRFDMFHDAGPTVRGRGISVCVRPGYLSIELQNEEGVEFTQEEAADLLRAFIGTDVSPSDLPAPSFSDEWVCHSTSFCIDDDVFNR